MSSVRKTLLNVWQLAAIVVLYIVAFSYAMFQGGFVSWFLFFTITPFVLYALLLYIVPLSFKSVSRELTPAKLQSGDAVTIQVTVERSNRFPLCFVALQDDVASSYTIRRRQLQFGGFRKTFTWELTHTDMARGEYAFHSLHIKCYDLFGWCTRSFTVAAPQSFLVYPQVKKLKNAAVQTQFERGATQSRYAVVKDTSMVTSVRNYQPGDRMSWIHWKSFAKTEQLRTKDFEDKQSQDLFVVFDLQQGAHFETSVSVAASVIEAFVKQQSDVVFMTLGSQRALFPMLQTASQVEEVLRHLAVVQPENIDSTKQLAHEPLLQQIGALVYITTAFNEELQRYFMRLNKQIICIVVNDEPKLNEHLQNVRIVYAQPDSFEHILVEVAKR